MQEMEIIMGSMILCRTRLAKRPYRINKTGVRIYSLEELCYYIYTNVYLLENDFVSEGLIDYIQTEIGEEMLAQRLRHLIAAKSGLAQMIVTILKYVDYYTIEEIEKIKGVLEALSTQNIYERLKKRGDSLLDNECYRSAAICYEKILNGPRDVTLPAYFYAKVNHNMGVAYSRLFLYKQAVHYFEEAFCIGRIEASDKCRLAAARLALGENIIERDDATEKEYVLKREIETLMDNARYSDDYRMLTDIEKIKDDGDVQNYYERITKVLEDWKTEYETFVS